MQVRCAHPLDEAIVKVSISAEVEQVSNRSKVAKFLHQA